MAWLMNGSRSSAKCVPAPGILLPRRVEVGVGAERGEERRLVVGRAADPAVGEPRPGGDGVARRNQVGGGFRRAEKGVRHTAIAGVGRDEQFLALFAVMQGVVEAGDHPRRVAEGRMAGHVLRPARRR